MYCKFLPGGKFVFVVESGEVAVFGTCDSFVSSRQIKEKDTRQ